MFSLLSLVPYILPSLYTYMFSLLSLVPYILPSLYTYMSSLLCLSSICIYTLFSPYVWTLLSFTLSISHPLPPKASTAEPTSTFEGSNCFFPEIEFFFFFGLAKKRFYCNVLNNHQNLFWFIVVVVVALLSRHWLISGAKTSYCRKNKRWINRSNILKCPCIGHMIATWESEIVCERNVFNPKHLAL